MRGGFCMKTKRVIFVVMRAILLFVIMPCLAIHFLLTGFPIPLIRIGSLKNPIQIQNVESTWFIGKQGEKIILPYVSELPITNIVFREALSRGVEVDQHGNVYGLLKIWHWCGNDPVRYHIQRINLSVLVATLEPDLLNISIEFITDIKMAEHALNAVRSHHQGVNSYSKHGWNINNLYRLEAIEKYCFPNVTKEIPKRD